MDRYRVQKREFSADVIEENFGTEEKPKWTVTIVPCSKGRFDNTATELVGILNYKPTK